MTYGASAASASRPAWGRDFGVWECAAAVPHLGWCAAIPQQPHDVWSLGRQALANGLVMACVLFGLFLLQTRYKSERQRSEYARSIFLELDNIRERLWPESGERARPRPDDGIVHELQRSRYDGLVSSAAITSLSVSLQQQLNDFYDLLREGHVEAMKNSILTLMYEVQRERKRGEGWWRFWIPRA